MFEPVDPKVHFPDIEESILGFWRDAGIFAKSLAAREDAPEWVFYEGPPTANGRPGLHHVEPRTFKDVYPRFKTMTGYRVPRKGGWDCHGLPVELEVEKEIGTTTKADIEAFGIAEFTALCRESVTRYVDDWEKLTERIGFWIDLSDAYWTMNTEYVESVWWSLKQLHSRGLLGEDHKVTAYCPRCGTALSDAEVAQGYAETDDPSVFLKFPILEAQDPQLVGAKIAVWTTTPWTLLSNLGLAVSRDEPYVVIDEGGERIIIAKALVEKVFGGPREAKQTFQGAYLLQGPVRYEPPFDNVEEGSTHTIVAGDFVSMADGTGVVHIAPAFGPDDLEVARANGWPVYNPVGADGTFEPSASVPAYLHGRFVKDADADIIEDLRTRGLLIRSETYTHSYPFCWRCKTPLLYYARTSWYIHTTQVKDRLLEVNQQVEWFPEHIKDGRYGNWLENNVDWALSRDRYWGTPLPAWRCEDGHTTFVGSLTELGELAGRDVQDIDPHRPAIDGVTIPCPECDRTATRVSAVIDTWYDSGAMPFAQWGYHPDLGRGEVEFETRFPADFISEAIDQTRGWFYTLMAEGMLHFDSTAYRNVVCLGHIVDGDGRKMSKSVGNVIDPWDVLNRQGADALRWFLLTSGSPWASRRVSMQILDESLRQFLLTLWNVYSFFVTYANAEGFDPDAVDAPPVAARPVLDRWICSQLAETVQVARDGLERYDATGAGRRVQRFVDDLSNWYVRRARRRFWNPGGQGDTTETAAAFATLHECLVTVAQLLAPFTPFVAEALWQNLAAGRAGRPESVHLSDYPIARTDERSHELDEAMGIVRDVASLGRTVRNDAKVKVRQPLAEAVLHFPGEPSLLEPVLPLAAEELNVRAVTFASDGDELGAWHAKPNFKSLGPKLGAGVKDLAKVLASDDGALAASLAAGDIVSIDVAGSAFALTPEDVELTQETRSGWGIASDGHLTVALDLEPSEDLRREGTARDVIRIVQDARKSAGLEVSDRIRLGIETTGAVQQAVTAHVALIAEEVLATQVTGAALDGDPSTAEASLDGVGVRVSIALVD